MSELSSGPTFELEHLALLKENVSGYEIAEYLFPSEKRKEGWSYKNRNGLNPESVIAMLLDDNGYEVMGDEGRLIRQLYNLLCLVAYEENENGPMIVETAGQIIIKLRPCFMTYPSASFTLEYIRNLLKNSSVDEVIEYIELYGPILQATNQSFDDTDLDLIHKFLSVFTLEKLLQMFELGLADNSGISGWPDITAIKNNYIYFIEVKTSDSLTKKQKYWLTTFKAQLDIDYRIIRVKPDQ